MVAQSVKFQKPIDEKAEVARHQKILEESKLKLAWLKLLAESLKAFEGKPINKRLYTALEKIEGCTVQSYYIAGMNHARIYQGEVSENFLLAYDTDLTYREAFLLDHNNLKPREEYIKALEAGIPLIPEFVSRYNALLKEAKLLVMNAVPSELEYAFDICTRSN